MPFKKRKEKKARRAQELNDRHDRKERAISRLIEMIRREKDPAQRIIALHNLDKNLCNHIKALNRDLTSKTFNVEEKVYAGTSLTTMMGGISMPIAASLAGITSTAIIAPVMIGAVAASFGFLVLNTNRKNHVAKKVEKTTAGHLETVKSFSPVIAKMLEEAVQSNVQAVLDSPVYEQAMEVPGISKMFLAATKKHINEINSQSPEMAPAAKTVIKLTRRNENAL